MILFGKKADKLIKNISNLEKELSCLNRCIESLEDRIECLAHAIDCLAHNNIKVVINKIDEGKKVSYVFHNQEGMNKNDTA